jgi:PQQ-like domain
MRGRDVIGPTRGARVLSVLAVAASLVGQQGSGGASSTSPTAAGDWPQFHHDAALSGFNRDETILGRGNVASLVEKWAVPTEGGGAPDPVVANGLVYVAPTDGVVRALDATTGALVWSRDLGGTTFGAAPTVADGTVLGARHRGQRGVRRCPGPSPRLRSPDGSLPVDIDSGAGPAFLAGGRGRSRLRRWVVQDAGVRLSDRQPPVAERPHIRSLQRLSGGRWWDGVRGDGGRDRPRLRLAVVVPIRSREAARPRVASVVGVAQA